MKLTARVVGVDVLTLKTKALVEAARWGMKAGVAEAGQIIQLEAQNLVPVDTGHLRDSIHCELIESTDDKATVAVMAAYLEPNSVGFSPEYARRIELGYVGPDSLGRVYNQPPQPFMRPAFDNKRDEALQAIRDSIFSELQAARL